ncbi:MAG TPA: hypothetical protein VF679_01010 [Pedobacter sp.]|jgi:hypothetical protein
MITQQDIVDYFEALAIDSKDINHQFEGKKTFFFVEDSDTLDGFDDALRNSAASPVMLIMAADGEFDDAGSNNYTQEVNIECYILARVKSDLNSIQAKSLCLPIALGVLSRMRIDSNKGVMIGEKRLKFRIEKVPYQSVGPMNTEWYGYAVLCTFYCPLNFKLTSASWRSIPE